MADKKQVVRLYRHILKLAKQYPSVKRDAIIQDIKLEFHEAKHVTDARTIEHKIAAAQSGIKELSMYATLNPSSTSWTVGVGREVSPEAAQSSGDANTKVVGDKQ